VVESRPTVTSKVTNKEGSDPQPLRCRVVAIDHSRIHNVTSSANRAEFIVGQITRPIRGDFDVTLEYHTWISLDGWDERKGEQKGASSNATR
jgi:hypothetical protein